MTEQDAAAAEDRGSPGRPGDSAAPPAWPEAVDAEAPSASAEPTWAWPNPSRPRAWPRPLEAILMVVDEPVAETTLAQVLERPQDEVAAVVAGLAAEYDDPGRAASSCVRSRAGGGSTPGPSCAAVVERFVLDGQQARLTQAALETLAVVAYRQPVSRARVSAVRGVNVDGVMRTLTTRGLVEEAGVDRSPGRSSTGRPRTSWSGWA